MLYQYLPESRACWSGKSDSWHYDTEYVLRGETRPGQARVQLLEADGTTEIIASPDVYVSESNNTRTGYLGLTTRGAPADFWGWQLR